MPLLKLGITLRKYGRIPEITGRERLVLQTAAFRLVGYIVHPRHLYLERVGSHTLRIVRELQERLLAGCFDTAWMRHSSMSLRGSPPPFMILSSRKETFQQGSPSARNVLSVLTRRFSETGLFGLDPDDTRQGKAQRWALISCDALPWLEQLGR